MVFKFSSPSALQGGSLPIHAWPDQGAAWVESLSCMRSSEAARSLCSALYALNRAKVADEERLQLLEVYRPTILHLITDLSADYNQARVPLPATAREAANLARRLLIEYACGYKLLLLDKADSAVPDARRQMPMLLHRAVTALSDALALSYQAYAPTPAGVWHEIHQIYRYAEHYAMDEIAIAPGGAIEQSTIGLIYKQTLLLSLTDPYRLMPGEVNRVLAIVDRFRGGAMVLPYSARLSGEGLFLVQSDGDKPPKPLAETSRIPITPSDKVLNAASLVVSLGQHRAQLESQALASALDSACSDEETKQIDLLRRLEGFWSSPPMRVFNRSASDSGVEICSGIVAVCHFLRRARIQAGAPLESRTGPETTGAEPSLPGGAGKVTSPAYARWQISNQSAGGLAVRKTAGDDSAISVGEVVAIRYPGQSSWGVGTVRWMQSDERDGFEFGIQMLAPGAVAVSIEAGASTGAKLEAVLLPELPALKKAPALLAPRGVFKERGEFLFSAGGAQEPVKVLATRLLTQTASYEIFEFIRF